MKIKYSYYRGENARNHWAESRKLAARYKKLEQISDRELLDLLNKVELLTVEANAHGGCTDLEWTGEEIDKAWMMVNCDDDDRLALFIKALPRLQELLAERLASVKT